MVLDVDSIWEPYEFVGVILVIRVDLTLYRLHFLGLGCISPRDGQKQGLQ